MVSSRLICLHFLLFLSHQSSFAADRFSIESAKTLQVDTKIHKDRSALLLLALATDTSGNVTPDKSKKIISPSDLVVIDTLNFQKKIQRHAEILNLIGEVQLQAESNKNDAEKRENFKDYKSAEEDIKNVQKAAAPYAIAQTQSKTLVDQGFKINDFSGNACKSDSTCKLVDPMVAVFFFTGDRRGLGPAFSASPSGSGSDSGSGSESGAQSGDVFVNGFNVSLFIRFLSGKPLDLLTFGILPGIRDAIIPADDNGELARIIRDPIKRPVEIVKDIRDSVVTGNGEGAKIIRDPIKCTIGHLWHAC